jgi:hypothetical protein
MVPVYALATGIAVCFYRQLVNGIEVMDYYLKGAVLAITGVVRKSGMVLRLRP